ncbi:late cornified envelope-like proline-rich protein 1 isoform X2 [Polypterus senegalus]
MKESFNLRFTRDLNISLRMSVSLSLECMIGASHSERGYHLFGPLKELLGGKKFKSNEKVTDTGQQLVNMQSEDLYSSGIKKLPERWNKGIAVAEDYIERQCKDTQRRTPPQQPEKAPPQQPEKAPPQCPEKAPPQQPEKAPPQQPEKAPPQCPEKALPFPAQDL